MPSNDEEILTADLSALAAVAQGCPQPVALPRLHLVQPPADPEREAKIAALKAKYEAGELTVDAEALAAKLVDAHLKPDNLG